MYVRKEYNQQQQKILKVLNDDIIKKRNEYNKSKLDFVFVVVIFSGSKLISIRCEQKE